MNDLLTDRGESIKICKALKGESTVVKLKNNVLKLNTVSDIQLKLKNILKKTIFFVSAAVFH